MKDLRGQARVTAFLRKSLAEGAQDVLKLEAMARTEGPSVSVSALPTRRRSNERRIF